MLLDTMPGCGALAGFAAEAAGDDDRYQGACDDEVAGAISAWDRVEAYAAARKLAAVAEFIRRRPHPDCPPGGRAQMPETWDESTVTDHSGRAHLHHRTHPVPHLSGQRGGHPVPRTSRSRRSPVRFPRRPRPPCRPGPPGSACAGVI
jgi:hypothetical protein